MEAQLHALWHPALEWRQLRLPRYSYCTPNDSSPPNDTATALPMTAVHQTIQLLHSQWQQSTKRYSYCNPNDSSPPNDTATALPMTADHQTIQLCTPNDRSPPNTWHFGLGRRRLAGLDVGLEKENIRPRHSRNSQIPSRLARNLVAAINKYIFVVQCPHHMSLWTWWSSLLDMAAV